MQNAVHIYKGNIVGASSGGGGSSDPAVFTITLTGFDPNTVDKTPAEVEEAYEAGKVIQFSPEPGVFVPLSSAGTSGSTNKIYYFTTVGLVRRSDDAYVSKMEIRLSSSSETWSVIDVNMENEYFVRDLRSVSPTASLSSKIFQHSGLTNANFTNGYFYKCVSDGQSPATYSWQQIDVQPSSGGPAVFTITLSGTGEQGDPYVVDKTPAEVSEAYEAGKVLVMERDDSGGEKLQLIQGYTDPSVSFAFGMTVVMPRFGEPIIVSHVAMLNSNDGVDWDSINVVPTEFTYCQLSTMITTGWTGEDVGKVFQYVGTTDANYTKGYFYKLNRDTTTMPSTYFWEQINVQPSFIDSGTTDLTPGTSPLSTGSLYVVYE